MNGLSPADRINVLLVEDNPGDARLVQEMLKEERRGTFGFIHAETLSDAIDVLGRDSVDVDVVVLDLGLPDSSGIESLRRLRHDASDVPVLVLTGNCDDTLGLAALQEGAQDYYSKAEIRSSLLASALRYAIERQSLINRIKRREAQLQESERVLRDLNRTHRTLSRCNEILVRSETESSLVASICRTIVETGEYAAATFGIADPGENGAIRTDSQVTLSDKAKILRIPWDDPNCPIVAAAKAKRMLLVTENVESLACNSCREFMAPLGFKELVAFPLVWGEQLIGVLVVFADLCGSFGTDSASLLEELAGDMAFGIATLRIRAEHVKTMDEMRKLTRAVEQSPVIVIITDAEGRIEYVNPKFVEVTGYGSDEAIGAKPSLLKSGEMEPTEYKKLWTTIKGGGEWRGLFHNKRKDGSLFWGETAISPVTNLDGRITHFIGIQEDATERLAAERRLRHADKMDSLGNLASGIAHDFNNMLLPIGMLTDLVVKRMAQGSKDRQRLERVLEATKRAQSLAQQILSFSRSDEEQGGFHEISDITSATTNLLKSTLSKTISLTSEIAAAVGYVSGNRAQIESVILNLTKNAADAMAGKTGRLLVKLDRMQLGSPLKGEISTIPAGSYARLTIADTGTGIAPSVLAKIFDPFYTTKAKGEGTGLGLAMTRTIVLKLSGTILVESQLDIGTTFRVFLPLIEDAAGE